MLLGILGACLLFWSIKAIHHALQPKYQGKTAQEWFAQINTRDSLHPNQGIQIIELDPEIQAFKHFGPDAARFLWKELKAEDSAIKTWSIDHLQTWSNGRWRIESSQERNVKAWVCLQQLGERADCLMPEIIAQAGGKDKTQRYGALQLIGSIGTRTEQTVPLLVSCLSDPDPWIVESSLSSLTILGPAATNALPELAHQLSIKTDEDRLQIAAVMVSIGDKSKLSILTDEALNAASLYQPKALEMLGDLEGKAADALPALAKLSGSPGMHPSIQLLAVKTMDRISPGRAQSEGLIPNSSPD